jgi:cytochrome P450
VDTNNGRNATLQHFHDDGINTDAMKHPKSTPPQLPYATLKTLPVVNGVLWETLCMYPPVPSERQREALRGSAPVTGANTWLPEGMMVSAGAYTVQRNADVFPQPDVLGPAH